MDAQAFVAENKEKMLALSAMCQEVGRELKRGLKEAHYQAALCRELQLAHIEYVSEESMPILYKGVPLGGNLSMRLDICIPAFPMIVELKAIKTGLGLEEYWQVLRYMDYKKYPLGAVINFSQSEKPERSIEIKFVVKGAGAVIYDLATDSYTPLQDPSYE